MPAAVAPRAGAGGTARRGKGGRAMALEQPWLDRTWRFLGGSHAFLFVGLAGEFDCLRFLVVSGWFSGWVSISPTSGSL